MQGQKEKGIDSVAHTRYLARTVNYSTEANARSTADVKFIVTVNSQATWTCTDTEYQRQVSTLVQKSCKGFVWDYDFFVYDFLVVIDSDSWK